MEVKAVFRGWHYALFEYGIKQGADAIQKNRIKFVNYLILLGLPFTVLFGTLNLFHGRFLLAALNFSALACSALTYFIHPYKKFDLLKLFLNFALGLICSIQAVCFHNGLEFYHIQNLVLILIFFDDRYFIIPASIYTILLFTATKYIITTQAPYVFAIDQTRALINIFLSVLTTLLGALYFKQNLLRSLLVLEKNNNELEASNRTKEKLFSIIAHDFRSPIGQIKGTLDLVNSHLISKEEFNDLSIPFNKQLSSLLADMDNLLIWSQGQLTGISTQPSRFLIKEIISEVAILLNQTAHSKQIGIEITVDESFVYADVNHIRIILRNLLANAIKFSKQGSQVYIKSFTESNEAVITIEDMGIGMCTHQLLVLQNGGSIGSNLGTNQEKGTGLGLEICREFLAINQGRLVVNSQKDIGTTFCIYLPAEQAISV